MASSRITRGAARDVLWATVGLHNFPAGQIEAIEYVVHCEGLSESLLCVMAAGSGKVRDRH